MIPCDDLAHHKAVNASAGGSGNDLRIYPTFRPDKALQVDAPEKFNAWVTRLEEASDTKHLFPRELFWTRSRNVTIISTRTEEGCPITA